ncbi:MAG: carboxypeptidase-like regulatory domain-containing protein, partial [Muribaculaceae bacterium]|nr:carboxypeptidase-like regulatory domain-containing protein [Muribaculaceae bacterium]
MAGYAQSEPVTGLVTDEKGEPLIGVTVKVKDSPRGTATDLDGRFSIVIPDKKNVLSFSYVGYRSM